MKIKVVTLLLFSFISITSFGKTYKDLTTKDAKISYIVNEFIQGISETEQDKNTVKKIKDCFTDNFNKNLNDEDIDTIIKILNSEIEPNPEISELLEIITKPCTVYINK